MTTCNFWKWAGRAVILITLISWLIQMGSFVEAKLKAGGAPTTNPTEVGVFSP